MIHHLCSAYQYGYGTIPYGQLAGMVMVHIQEPVLQPLFVADAHKILVNIQENILLTVEAGHCSLIKFKID